MIHTALALVLGLAAASPTAVSSAGPSEAPLRSTVWAAGDAGYHTFRIPSVISLPDGDLLAFAEGRKRGSSDTGDIDLVMKRSSDRGATWSPLAVVWDDGENVCGNPCAVRDERTGVVHLLGTHNLGDDKESEIIRGTSQGTRTVWHLTSSDRGATWSEPREITATAKRASWTWYATGPGIGIQLSAGPARGRLVIPCDHIERDSKGYYSHVILSDDHGASWRVGGRSTRDQLNECQVAELATGELTVNMRNYDRTQKTRAVMGSLDGGESFGPVSWAPQLPDPICQAGLVAVRRSMEPSAPRDLYFSNCASATQRERMTLKRSADGGATWRELSVLHGGPAAYSCLVALDAPKGSNMGTLGSIGCLFECGEQAPYERIDFARLPRD